MNSILTSRHIAAVATWLAALAALISAIVGTFPQGWQNTALAVVAILTKGAVAVRFLSPQPAAPEVLTPGAIPSDV